MIDLFFQLLQMSLAGSFAVFYLLILRVVLGKMPKAVTYVLWGLVAIHLIFVSVPIGRFALIPKIDIVQGFWRIDINWNVVLAVYLAGVAVIFLINGANYVRLSAMLSVNSRKSDDENNQELELHGKKIPVFYNSSISGAFTLGYFPPRIYLPEGIDSDMERMVVCHEMTHIRRGDYFTKLLAFVLCALNWFNPILWCAFYFFVRDQESSCDELVLRKIGIEQKKQYAEAILNAASGFFRSGEIDHAMPFGEANIKYRIRRCVKADKIEKRKIVAMILVTFGFFVLGIFVSNVFQINRLPFMAEEQPGIICAYTINDEHRIEYQLRGNGIYRVDENGEERIYKESLSVSDNFYFGDQGLFFMTYNAREIRYLDLETNKWQKVFRCEKDRKIASFVPYGGFVRINYEDGSVEHRKLCLKPQNIVSEQEILSHPGEIYNVTLWENDGAYAYLDLDMDGKDEELLLDFSMEDMLAGGEWFYDFYVNKELVLQEEVNKLSNVIYAASFDGEHIYIALMTCNDKYDSRESTTFYRYENGMLVSYGKIQAPVSLIKVRDDKISVSMSEKVILGETFEETWLVDENGRLVKMEEENSYIETQKAYELQKDIYLHTEPGSEETFCVPAQRVEMHKFMRNRTGYVDGVIKNGYWVELTVGDGTSGWIFCSDGRLENGDYADQVFKMGVYIHMNSTSDKNMIEEK
ncbi:MAG: M56 family metallopeptidase [Lachnospiraceae bacterium]